MPVTNHLNHGKAQGIWNVLLLQTCSVWDYGIITATCKAQMAVPTVHTFYSQTTQVTWHVALNAV